MTLFIAQGQSQGGDYVQSFNGTLRAEGLIPEIFTSLTEGGILVERWRWEDKQVPPHSAIVPQHIPGSISRSGFIGASSTAGGRGGSGGSCLLRDATTPSGSRETVEDGPTSAEGRPSTRV